MKAREDTIRFLGLCLPGFLLVIVLVVVPLQGLILLSFVRSSSFDLIFDFSLANYLEVWGSWAYMKFLVRSFIMATGVTIAALLLAWPTAYWIAKFGGRRKTIYLLFTALPFFSGLILHLVALQHLLGPGAILDQVFQRLNLGRLSGFMYSDLGTFIGLVYLWLPFAILAIYLSFITYPFDLERVAAVNGAGAFRTVFQVALPLNRLGLIIGGAIVFLPALGASTEALFLGGPNGSLFGEVIRRQIMTGTWPRGATLLVTLLMVSFAVLFVMWRLLTMRGGVSIEALRRSGPRSAAKIYTPGGRVFGRMTLWLNYFFLYSPVAVLVAVSFNESPHVLLPFSFTLKWFDSLLSSDRLGRALWNSLVLALGASSLAVVVSGLAAVAFARYRRARISNVALAVFLLPIILTPLTIGITSKLVLSRVFSLGGGIFAGILTNSTYVVTFCFLLLLLAFSQHDWEFERAARVFGANPRQVLFMVTLPMIFPALLGAFLVGFLIAFNNYHITFFTVGATPTLPTLIGGMLRHGLDEEVYALTVAAVGGAFILTSIAYFLVRGPRKRR